MIFIIYSLLHILVVSSFRYFPEDDIYNPRNSYVYTVPKYDSKIEDFPHHVLVYYARLYCSGSLISSRAVITAASCFYKRASETTYIKVGAKHYMDTKKARIRVIEVKLHEFYRRLTPVDNDIALLFLERHVSFSSAVKKIPLAEPEVSLRMGHAMMVTSYGAENVLPRFKNQLLATSIVVVETGICEAAFGNIMTFSNYCGKLYALDQHLSDNGGGATLHNFLVGILVLGATTDKPNAAIFTNVSYFHRWIVLNTQRYHQIYCNQSVGDEDTEASLEYGSIGPDG